jgi:hypothetical protein
LELRGARALLGARSATGSGTGTGTGLGDGRAGCFAALLLAFDAALEDFLPPTSPAWQALATLADAFFRSPRRASFFREPGFAAPDFVLGLGFATWMWCGT